MVTKIKGKTFYQPKRKNIYNTQNPADVRGGIDSSKIGMGSEAQKTPTKDEIADAKMGGDKAQQERIRATNRADPSEKGDVQRRVDAKNEAQNPMTPPSFPVETETLVNTYPLTTEDTLTLGEGQDESFFDRLGTTLKTGEISQDAGFNREVGLKDLSQIAATGLGIGAAAIFAGAGSAALISRAAAGQAVNTVNRFGINTKTAAKTGSWIGRMFKGIVKNPASAASAVLATVGTYPFAGFIKEEALQTLGFAGKNALDNGDLEGAAAAISATEEILNPTVWNQILAAIPSVNILKQVQNYLIAAEIQTKTQAKRYEKLRLEQDQESPSVLLTSGNTKTIMPDVPR
jgi:hypothetical protein